MRRPSLWFLSGLLFSNCCLGLSASAQEETSSHPILKGVQRVALSGIPSDLVIWNPKVRALLGAYIGDARVPVAAALQEGKGRLLVTGHGCFSQTLLSQANGKRFFANSLRWLAGSRKQIEVLYNTAFPVQALAHQFGWKTSSFSRTLPPQLNPNTQILLLNPSRLKKGDTHSLLRFVREGGSLYLFGVGWGYIQTHPGRDLFKEASFNRILVPFGLAIGKNLVSPQAITGSRKARRGKRGRGKKPRLYAALSSSEAFPLSLGGAISLLRREKPGSAPLTESAASTLLRCATLLPKGQPPLQKLFASLSSLTHGKLPPRTLASLRLLEEANPRLLTGAPGEDSPLTIPDFPGRMPKAPPVQLHRRLNLATPGWISTGLYVPPGRIVGINIRNLVKAPLPKIQIQIGAHSDRLWKKRRWRRDPVIVKRFPLKGATKILSRYGGLLYLQTQRKGWVSPFADFRVELRTFGAVEAPRFVLGKTSLEAWQRMLESPAPWGEIEGRRIIFTMQTQKLRRLKDPRVALAFWDQVIDLYEKLDPQPPRPRKQRVVFDRQISAGALHSGYPIMGHLQHQDPVVNPENYLLDQGKRKGRFWGLLHELGHNYQQRAWTFNGTGEVTNNVFVLYANEKLLGAPIAETIQQRRLQKQKKTYFAKGSPFSRWKKSPFLALMTYIELIQHYGWKSLHKVYQGYRDHPLPHRTNDHQKIQQYVLRWCRVTGKNLAPFFLSWGWPLDASTTKACADFPAPSKKHRRFE